MKEKLTCKAVSASGERRSRSALVHTADVYAYSGLTVGLGTQKMYKMAYHGYRNYYNNISLKIAEL